MIQPFIIWSLPRCGSTTLLNIVRTAGANACNEPFSNRNFEADFNSRSIKEPIADVLQSIFHSWDGFKHTAHLSGWPFPDNRTDINYSILTTPGIRFVLLKRRNIIKRAVSAIIARQCGLWNCNTSPEETESRNKHSFGYIDEMEVSKELEQSSQFMNLCQSLLEKSGNEFISVMMEDVISPNREEALRVYRFLGLQEPNESDLDSIIAVSKESLSSFIYDKIPEIEHIEWKFGGSEWGSLMKA